MGYVIKPMISGPTPSGTEWKPLLPPTYFLASIIVMVGLDILLPGARVLSFPLTLAGLAPMIVGGALNVAADRAFKRNKTTVKPFEVSTSLVTEGVFRVSRNPMYLGMILILLGIALLLGALYAFRRVCSVRPSHAGALRPGRRANAGGATWSGMATLQRTGSTLVLAAPAADRGHLDLRGIGRKPKLALPHRVRWNRPQR
jgi:hypothetical protein